MTFCNFLMVLVDQVNEYPWIAAFDFNGVDGTSPGGCAASLVRFHSSKSVNQTQVSNPSIASRLEVLAGVLLL